jgi:hypothetical protein
MANLLRTATFEMTADANLVMPSVEIEFPAQMMYCGGTADVGLETPDKESLQSFTSNTQCRLQNDFE